MPIVDTHVHCFAGPNDERFPYHPLGPYQPAKVATPERLLELMDAAGVDFAVIVHPEPYQDDHRSLEHCLDVGNGRLKGVCHFFAHANDSVQRMIDLVRRRPGQIVALRIHAYAPERLPKFDSAELRTLCRAAADLGLALQLHFEPRYATALEPLVREFKSTPVLVDHLGRPFQGTADEYATVLRWSERPNVSVKLSSLPVKEEYPHRDITPIVQQLVAAFGADRLIYGGGFNADATAVSYRAARERVASQLGSLSEADVAKVLGGNAAKLFGFV
ncbi:MAG: amidohydrolase family protein [Planctomycetota bacterium]|nr:amidohydrolase family protein [Planctomycetaceae bacterium]MDQ3329730.1 amidohydrolase family protein [Planctomycetota bacterium]